MLKKVFSEPLFQFLVLGLILYGYFIVTEKDSPTNTRVITITQDEIMQIKSKYKTDYNRELGKMQLEVFIKNMYRDKILLNEAYTLGIDKKDELIQKRLLKQMRFILLNSSEILEPSEEELYKYYQENIQDYSIVDSLSFAQVLFLLKDDLKSENLLRLFEVSKIDPNMVGAFSDESSLKNYTQDATYEELLTLYGKYFTNKIINLKQGIWHKNIHSKYGQHLLFITKKRVLAAYPFDEVQDRVYSDYMREYKAKKEEESYTKIFTQYTLELE